MSSTNKSEKLKLNQWLGSDIPCREDFNNDNAIIDGVVGGHLNNRDMHTSAGEKAFWNNPYYMTTYYGNGASSRTININCAFEPNIVIVFASAYPPSIVDPGNDANYNYFGIATLSGSNTGLSISKRQLSITQSALPVSSTEYRNYNEYGVTYIVIAIR